MTRKLVLVLGLAALTSPAFGQDYGNGEPEGWFGDEAAPQPEGIQGQEDDGGAGVDVSVDMATPGASVTFDTFHDGLSAQGEWVDMPAYGRVWRPAGVASGWRPYYYGRWEWTDEGWLWVSDEPWGWATYHYGRWAYDGGYGWVWVPGYQWAPAWVTWRYSPDYIGWAPLGPGFSVYVSSYPVVYSWWTFVPCARFVGVPVFTVGFTGGQVRNIWHGTRPAPPRTMVGGAPAPAWGGPARPFIENRGGRPVVAVRVQQVGSPAALRGPARPGFVPIFRPEARPAPRGFGGSGSALAPAPGRGQVPGAAVAPRPWGGGQGQAGPRPGAPAPQPYGGRPSAPPQIQNRFVPPQQQGGQPRYAPTPSQQQGRRYAPAPQGARPAAPPQQMQNRFGGSPQQAQPRYAPAPQGQPRYAAPPQQTRPSASPAQHGGGGRPAPAHGGNRRER